MLAFQKSASASAQSLRATARNAAPATSAAIAVASVKTLTPAFSSQRSCAVDGPVRAMKPSARRTMSVDRDAAAVRRAHASAAASSTGNAVSSSCTPCQYGVPPSHWFWFQWPSSLSGSRSDSAAYRAPRDRRRARAARRRIEPGRAATPDDSRRARRRCCPMAR